MPSAIDISPHLDITGIATMFLAAATAGLAWWTRRAVDQGAIEVERAHRPVVVPLPDPVKGIGEALQARQWPRVTPGDRGKSLFVAVRNVGMGPALDVRATVQFGDEDGNPSTSGIAQQPSVTEIAALAAGPMEVLMFEVVPVTSLIGFRLTIEYSDVAGARWHTRTRFSNFQSAYVDLSIEAIRA